MHEYQTNEKKYQESVEYLYGLNNYKTDFSLKNIKRLCEIFEHPEKDLRFIHVAGTNGKGSVCAMLESVYRHAGYKTGMYTSPHLVYFGERIQVNNTPISKNRIVSLTQKIKKILDECPKECHPTFFEVTTLLALLYFKEEKAEIILWETGLGGRLDATNIVDPLASIITNVSLEHQQYLGDTIEKIAHEKAGIIKTNVPVITGAQDDSFNVIADVANAHNSPIYQELVDQSLDMPDHFPEYQKQNILLVLKAVEVLRTHLPVPQDEILESIFCTQWPGRFQLIKKGNNTFLLDGAHNPAGFSVLVNSIKKKYPLLHPTVIIGMLKDKDWEKSCSIIGNLGEKYITTSVNNYRTLTPELLSLELAKYHHGSVQSAVSLKEALDDVKESSFILICGSLYLIGEALKLLSDQKCYPIESKLNEWG